MNNKIELKKISDEAAVYSLLLTAKGEDEEIYIWRYIGNTKHMARVKLESIRRLRKEICVIPADKESIKKVDDIIGSNLTVDLYIPESSLLFRCNIKQSDGNMRYYLEIPKIIAQSDRRKHLRLNVHGNNEVKVQFLKTIGESKSQQKFTKGCYDISAGGFSFYISRAETKFFNVSDHISSVMLNAGEWTGKIDVEIVLIKEIEPSKKNGLTYKAWRVSCRYNNIDQISKKYLEKFVFERLKNDVHAINE